MADAPCGEQASITPEPVLEVEPSSNHAPLGAATNEPAEVEVSRPTRTRHDGIETRVYGSVGSAGLSASTLAASLPVSARP